MIEFRWTFSNPENTMTWRVQRGLHVINIGVNQALLTTKKSDVQFEDTFSIFVSHEVLHAVLYEYISREVWDKLDNICDKKLYRNITDDNGHYFFKSMKKWFGGIVVN